MKKYVGKMKRNSKQKNAKKKGDYYNKENDNIKIKEIKQKWQNKKIDVLFCLPGTYLAALL